MEKHGRRGGRGQGGVVEKSMWLLVTRHLSPELGRRREEREKRREEGGRRRAVKKDKGAGGAPGGGSSKCVCSSGSGPGDRPSKTH